MSSIKNIYPNGTVFNKILEYFQLSLYKKDQINVLSNVLRLDDSFNYYFSEDPPINSLDEELIFDETVKEAKSINNSNENYHNSFISIDASKFDAEIAKTYIHQCVYTFIQHRVPILKDITPETVMNRLSDDLKMITKFYIENEEEQYIPDQIIEVDSYDHIKLSHIKKDNDEDNETNISLESDDDYIDFDIKNE